MIEVFIDLETTGLNHYKNGVVQIAAILFKDGKKFDEINLEFAPLTTDEIHPKALETIGKTEEELWRQELKPVDALSKFKAWLGQYIDPFNNKEKAVFYGYNARFDMDFMRQWFFKLGDKFFGSWFWFPPIDVMNLAADYVGDERNKLKSFKQGKVAEFLGIEVDSTKLHDAMYDIELTVQIYNIVGKNPLN